ncbi:hypothetical protein [Denitrobaculum tricleocarpae]|uniref:Uncharacterized protein n=1 Tax=Denitrobaculum tricleocarpae TaxID=2591009 RepID=A0A545TR48_9PROT|nr:hypothetical protein [Denitrobaculum tricleocarpae]TQV79601.1 hypothetical protein FKG95_12800 [Denitrobaculum tricleocarpae]
MRKRVAVPAAALTLAAFLVAPAAVYACSGMKSVENEAQTETQTAQTLIPTTTGSAPMTLKPETKAN